MKKTADNNSKKRLLVMAGGTGGHIFPGLAVANALKQQGWEVEWLGTNDRMESTLVPKYNIPINFITISGVRGKGIKTLLIAPFKLLKAIYQAKKIIDRYQPDVVLGMGGYVSGPGGIAAKLSKIPIVLHEQNGVAGLTNYWLAKISTVLLQAFPTAFLHGKTVGNPVRDDVVNIAPPEARFAERSGPIRLLIMGGSQGAKIINETMASIIDQLGDSVTIQHQVGKGNVADISVRYGERSKQHIISEFIDDVAAAYSWADLVICRAGALTVSEIQVAGLGAIFIPFQHKDRQQYWNAKSLSDIDAAIIIEQTVLSSEKILSILHQLDRAQLLNMAVKARSIAIPDATKIVVQTIIDIVTANYNK